MTEVAALNIKVATADVKKAQTDLAALEKSGAGAEKSMQGLTNVAAKLAAALAGLGAATFIKEASLLAARYETLGVVMIQAGKNAGYGSDQMRKFEKDLRAQGIAAIEARQNIAKMAAAQMDLAQAGQLARAAQDLAVVGGINSSEAFSRLTRGIQSGETEVLRTIGLNVSWEESYKRVAKEMGKNADKLTVQEKLQARVNEVLLRAKEYNGIYEESMKTAGKQISSFSRYWQDMQVDLGNSELPAVTILVKEATKRIKEFTEYIQKEDTQKGLSALGNTAVLTFDTIAKLSQQIGPLFIGILNGYNSLPDIVKEVGLVGVILGGKQGKLVLASLALFSSVSNSLSKISDAKSAFGNEGVAYFSREKLNEQTEFARSMEGIQQRLARVRKEMASGAGVSFYSDENAANMAALKKEESRLVGLLADSSGLKLLQAKENDIRAAQARIYGGVGFIPDKAKPKVETTVDKKEEAIQRKLSELRMKWEEERGKRYLDHKQAIYDSENEIKLKLQEDAYRIATEFDGRALEAQKQSLREQYAAAAELTQDKIGLAKKLEEELKKLDTARLATSRNAWDGAKVALDAYADSATNAAANMGRVFTNAFTSMEDALVKFATTGKLNFTDMTRSIIADIVRIQIRASITGPIASGISSGGLWPSITGMFGFNHGGGMVGSPTFSRQVPLSAFAGAERFHSGGFPGLKSDEVPIIAQRGERVLSRQEVASGTGGGSGTHTVTVIMKDAKGNQTAAPMNFNTNGMREFILNVVRDGSERGLLGSA